MNKEATQTQSLFKPVLFRPENILVYGRDDQYKNHFTNTTATSYGGQIRLVRYLRPIKTKSFNKRKVYVKATITKRLDKNTNRSKNRVYQLIMQNWKPTPDHYFQNPVWATLTYPDSQYAKITNKKSHIKDLNKFTRLLRKKYGNALKYIAVMELTRKENVHFHLLIFNMPKYESAKDVAQIWIDLNAGQGRICSHGGQDVKRVKWGYKNARKHATELAGYLSKYVTKTFNQYDMSHEKAYLPSQGLAQPDRFTTADQVDELLRKCALGAYYLTFRSQVYDLPFIGEIQIEILEPWP